MNFDQIYSLIHENVHLAPFIVFFLFLLAGLNLPVSEDILIFVSALLASDSPKYTPYLFAGVYLGAYVSDLEAYWIGRLFLDKIFKIKLFAKTLTKQRVEKVSSYLEKYGIWVYIIGRFIPFGVRNLLFMSSGIIKFNFIKFAFFDGLAALITCSIYFTLYYKFGESILPKIKQGNIIIFIIFVSVIGIVLLIKAIKIFIAKFKKRT